MPYRTFAIIWSNELYKKTHACIFRVKDPTRLPTMLISLWIFPVFRSLWSFPSPPVFSTYCYKSLMPVGRACPTSGSDAWRRRRWTAPSGVWTYSSRMGTPASLCRERGCVGSLYRIFRCLGVWQRKTRSLFFTHELKQIIDVLIAYFNSNTTLP